MVLAAKPKKPASEHHRKRNGQHHKHTKPYAKAYWPYLPMLAIIGLGFILNMLWPQPGAGVLSYATNMSISGLLNQTNQQRQTEGQTGLTINDKLMAAAQAKADDMASRGYWSHTTPDGKEPWWFVSNAGYDYLASGENLAYGFDTSQAAVTGWMNSPGHRANILNAGYREVGFGIANAENYQGRGQETIVVALYGTPVGPVVATAPETSTSPSGTQPAPAATTDSASRQDTLVASSTQPAAQELSLQPGTAAAAPAVAVAETPGPQQRVARVELVAADISPWTVVIITLIAGAAGAVFILRHVIFWRRALVHGEMFIIRHWKLDLVIVGITVVTALLTRTAGFIQ